MTQAILAASLLSAAAAPGTPTPANPNEVVVRYLLAWNEHDAQKRRDLVARAWTDDGSYADAHRHGRGHDQIDAMIAKAQEQFPGYTLRLVSGIEAHNGTLRFSWAAGGQESAPLYLAGTDFVVLGPDGRIKSVTGFVDAAPAH
ncbi:MAG: nuclear transport factor 2 family protein [Myxococcales bacterium]